MTEVFRNIASMRRKVAQWRAAGEKIALVPTMGALHAGHISLVEASRAHATPLHRVDFRQSDPIRSQ